MGSIVRGTFVAQATKSTRAAVGCLLAKLAHLTDECLDLLLLLKDGLVELLYQVFGEASFDLKFHQSLVYVFVWHLGGVLNYLILASSARKSSNWSL